ncbi:CHAT domain-containing protein [Antrihabitans sp. YC3-6]|uniref:CHAT domain-containing protein n=1 Tax=Antrihabitans stalagmiti TaxID=2799499 RepID=A0A934U596_9NOCA|nr:CHAT domain-containing protein [Antrihabitans stalagmiti]MBJ8341221.1 CHAT domain-containing protein [Antrihabitans stalagmiti]
MYLNSAREMVVMIDVIAQIARGEHAQRTGRADEARAWFARAIDASLRPGAVPHLLPLALVSAQRLDEAREALDAAHDSGKISDQAAATLYVRAKAFERAHAALDRATAWTEWRDPLMRAGIDLERGNVNDAKAAVSAAIAMFEAEARLLLRDPDRLDACDQPDVAKLYATLAMVQLAKGDVDGSFNSAERARSFSFDTLIQVNPVISQWWQRAAAQYSAISNTIVDQLPTAAPDRTAGLFAKLDAADADLAAAERAVDAASPGLLLRRSAPGHLRGAADIQDMLAEGTLLLEYLAVGDDLLMWAVTRDVLRPIVRELRSNELAVLVRDFQITCTAGRASNTALSLLLVNPVEDLLRTHNRLVIVPFGALTAVPFHALRLDGLPLMLTHVVSYLPRAEAYRPDVGVSTARPLIVGDPEFDATLRPDLNRLPGAQVEAAAIGALLEASDILLGAEATKAAVTARLEACNILHLSTHGHLDELSPFASSLVLAGQGDLSVADIAGLRFGTDLAVLSGCDTGRGEATLGGDVIGLTRSLLRSGVSQAVVSLWPVDDEVAPIVMYRFYQELAVGTPPASALATAQRAIFTLTPDDMHVAYHKLGGTPASEGTKRRRGLNLPPELRDDEVIPQPLSGDAERYWAPFMVVG